MTAFSVLLPVYAGDEPEHFARALASISVDQTLRPNEIVIVRDGPVPSALEEVIAQASEGSAVDDIPVTLVRINRNRGLADALALGLESCRYELVARADADDISVPERFARQLPLIAGDAPGEPDDYDLVGSAIQEFNDDEHHPGMVRRLPEFGPEIRRVARFRDPFNHPPVVYRKSAVARAGGYQHLAKMEDYWLFARMLQHGARVTNLPDPLVLYRVGSGAYKRRGGVEMRGSELALQHAFVRSGFVSRVTGARNNVVRGLYRLFPTRLRRAAYRVMMRLTGKR